MSIQQLVETIWNDSIIPELIKYIRIPNKSPLFDADWQKHGYMDQAVSLMENWCNAHRVTNMTCEVVRIENRTPVIFIEIPGDTAETVLLYGHLDKQPEMVGWDDDLGPWTPVLKGDKLYGRGSADDGYAVFASLSAIKALQENKIPHPRCVILIEACEESGSYDLPFYIDKLEDRIGTPNLIVCLDSGCGNYDQLWMTTSLRGVIGGVLNIEVLTQGVHSGDGSGVIPSCFMVLRQLLDRIENDTDGKILLSECFVEIPSARLQQAEQAAAVLGKSIYEHFPFQDGVKPVTTDLKELVLNRTWRPTLSVTGGSGLPMIEHAGNVVLPALSFKLSVRLPPTCDAEVALKKLKSVLESKPPYQAKVRFDATEGSTGWNAPSESRWLTEAANAASMKYFGKAAMYMGEGGAIPFMGMLGKKFPKAQFVITGVLGPGSNAHGPNEFLHIPTAKRLTCCIADIIAAKR